MSTTPYYNIPLLDQGEQDWTAEFERIVSALAELIARNQRPPGVDLRWGDRAAGNFVESNGLGTLIAGLLTLSKVPIKNLVLEQGASFPVAPVEGMIFYRTDDDTVYVFDGTGWDGFSVTAGAIQAGGGVLQADIGDAAIDHGNLAVVNNLGNMIGIGSTFTAGQGFVRDFSEISGWRGTTPRAEISLGSSKGALLIGRALNDLQVQDWPTVPGNQILQVDAGAISGFSYVQPLQALGSDLANKGELVASNGALGAVAVPPPSSGDILTGDLTQAGGMRWQDPATLGVTPNQLTNVAAKIFAFNTFS